MNYRYPAVFSPYKDVYTVRFPDLKGCNTFGKDMDEAVKMAEDAAALWLCDREERKLPPIEPYKLNPKSDNPDDTVMVINIDTDSYRRQNDNRAVKKTLSIPNWLNEKALAAHINFSAVLQDGLKRQLGITQ
jgi:predicted RNase H-like HicB family nuclease